MKNKQEKQKTANQILRERIEKIRAHRKEKAQRHKDRVSERKSGGKKRVQSKGRVV